MSLFSAGRDSLEPETPVNKAASDLPTPMLAGLFQFAGLHCRILPSVGSAGEVRDV
jgi:hypothetical protein